MSTLLRQMPSTIWRSVRQTPAPPMRTITSEGRLIVGAATSSYLTNSFAVRFSSNARKTAAFIFAPLDWSSSSFCHESRLDCRATTVPPRYLFDMTWVSSKGGFAVSLRIGSVTEQHCSVSEQSDASRRSIDFGFASSSLRAIAARGNDERIEFPGEPLSQVEALWSTHLRREAR